MKTNNGNPRENFDPDYVLTLLGIGVIAIPVAILAMIFLICVLILCLIEEVDWHVRRMVERIELYMQGLPHDLYDPPQ